MPPDVPSAKEDFSGQRDACGSGPVGTQCQEDYFYSKDRARFCEGYFGQVESNYGALMGRIGRSEPLDPGHMFLFFLCAVDFYARGSKFGQTPRRRNLSCI